MKRTEDGCKTHMKLEMRTDVLGLKIYHLLALRDILIKMSTAKCHANYAIWLNFVLF